MTQTLAPAAAMLASIACATPRPVATDWHMGALMLWHVTAAETGGLLSLGEVVVRRGLEPPMHVHAREDETWFVLDGTVIFQRGQERLRTTAGDVVLLPRGVPHGFAVQTPTAHMVHVYTPGGIEQAFRALSVPAPDSELPPAPLGPPDAATLRRLTEVYGHYGVTFVGPPLAEVLARETTF